MTTHAASKTPRAIGYLRVSTDKQTDSGLGLEAQRSAVDLAARHHGFTLAEVFTDAGASGSLDAEDREGLLGAIQQLRRGDVLIVAKRDRLGRDVIKVATIERLIERKGCRVVSAGGEGTDSDDPTAVLMRRMIDAFAEYERLLIGLRTKAALKAKRSRGERYSRFAPFGFRLASDGRLEIDADEQLVLDSIRQQREAGTSLEGIAATLNASGRPTRSGQPWRYQYVQKVLQRAA